MKNSEQTMIKLKRLATLVAAWMTIGVIVTGYDHFLIESRFANGGSDWYGFTSSLVFNLVASFIGGTLGGIFLLFYVNDKWRDKPYGFNIMAVTISFMIIFSFITVFTGMLTASFLSGYSFGSEAFNAELISIIQDPLHLKNMIIWSIVVALSQFVIMVNDKFGQGVLVHFLTGRYHQPRTEERVFMFADIKGSTGIAEKLGNEQYHNLLKDFFSDITNAIIENKGEVYQYVGDEVVISWPKQDGIKDANCFRCYVDMLSSIDERKEKYLRHYGLVPEFKAGLHYGEVMAGEVGVIKRDLTFSGDVLNTTSRIQEACKNYEVNLLASDQLLDQLRDKAGYAFRHIGEINLRGKSQLVGLSTFI
ncbi:MAG: adenylate/guanylate cyclase domain-containing protein [Bacteroidota bacterium]